MVWPRPSDDLVVDLVFVRDVVHEPGADRVLRQERTVIDQLAHFRVRFWRPVAIPFSSCS